MKHLPTRLRFLIRRAHDQWFDLLAVLAGYCNDCPVKSGLPDEGTNGYRHWRCALRRGHGVPHRYRNYTWGPSGRCEFDPVPSCPGPRRDVHGTPTLRQLRLSKEWKREQSEKRAAARAARRDSA